MPLSRVAVVLMTKYPEPGRVKTRLTPELTFEQAAAVHAAFLRHLVARVARLNAAELVVCFDPADRSADMRAFFEPAPVGLTLIPQVAGDLGDRLAAAALDASRRHKRLLFLGVDSPDVPLGHLFKAAELTELSPVSHSPTDDGGYWSLGLQRGVDAAVLLKDIPWSSGGEALATLAAADRVGHSAATGLAWDDVDRPADLRTLVTRLTRSENPADRELLAKLRPALPAGWGS
jgi:rSAM/selenodomain-associated transferase 1